MESRCYLLSLTLLVLLLEVASGLPGGYSQVGFSIYKNKQEYEQRRNPTAGVNPHTVNQSNKVLVTYAVGHPGSQGGYSDSGTDLSQAYYELTPQFNNHGQHQRQVETFRQGENSQRRVNPPRNYYQNNQAQPAKIPANRPAPAVQHHYTNPYVQTAIPPQPSPVSTSVQSNNYYHNPALHVAESPALPQVAQNQFIAPPARPVQSYGNNRRHSVETAKPNLDLSHIIPFVKNNPALTGGYDSFNSLSKNVRPKAEDVKQNTSPDAAINAALDERFPLQYFRK